MAAGDHREGSMSPRLRERVRTTRWLFLIAAVVYPVFGVVRGEVQPHHHDPLFLRFAISMVAVLLLGLSYSPVFSRRYLHPLVMTLVYLITGHFFYLLAMNRLSPEYLIGLLLVLAGVCAAATLAFQSRRGLVGYLGLVAAGTVMSARLAREPVLDPIFYLLVLFTSICLSWVALSSLIRTHRGLRESRRRLDAVVSGSPVLLWSIDRERRIDFVKGSGMRALGRDAERYLGKRLPELFDDGRDLQIAIDRALAGRPSTAVARVEGRIYETWHVPRWSGTEDLVGAIGVAADVTESRRMKTVLRRREEQLAEAQRIARLGSWEWDVEGNRVEWSDELFRIFGYEPGAIDVDFETYLDHVHEDDRERARRMAERAIEEGEPFDFVERIVRPDGKVRTIQAKGYAVDDEGGKPLRLVGVAHDVTERVRAEEELRHAQKMEAVGRMAGSVAHDFNNVLVGILGYCELLEGDLDDPLAQERLREIRRSAKRAGDLVQQLLSFGRRRPLEPERLDLARVVRDLEGLLARAAGERVAIDLDLEDVGTVEVDRSGLEQVLMNLVVNARDAMDGNGDLRIGMRETTLPEGAGKAPPSLPQGSYALLSVSDDGCGMDRKTLEHAFEPFFTTKPEGKGTGLGLPTVYAFAERSGGAVTVESAPGEGTTFRIYLPLLEADVISEPAATGSLPPSTPPAPRPARRPGD